MLIEVYIRELKYRIFYVLISFLFSFFILYLYCDNLILVLCKPLISNEIKRLIFTSLSEGFVSHIRLSLLTTILINIPFLLFQIFVFIRPALFKYENNFIINLLIWSAVLFLTGLYVNYNFLLPNIWKFFLSFQNNFYFDFDINLEAKLLDYINISLHTLLIINICFQLPIVIITFFKFHLIRLTTFFKNRKYIYFCLLILSSLISPPDIISQFILFVPLFIIYESTLILLMYYDTYF